jgi:hypothetical protein
MSREFANELWGEAVVEAMLARSARPPSSELLRQIREAATGGNVHFSRWALGLPLDTCVCVVRVIAGDALNDLLTPFRSVS